MWDVLSADFDQNITPEKCLENVTKNVKSGSVIVFHDSVKASPNLKFALPKTFRFLKENGFTPTSSRNNIKKKRVLLTELFLNDSDNGIGVKLTGLSPNHLAFFINH